MTRIGFVGLGSMGEAMALNLVAAGTPLTVWNRSPDKAKALEAAGATVAPDAAAVFDRSEVVFMMLTDADAVDTVLTRGIPEFAERVRGRTVVHMGTTEPAYSAGLEADVRAAGGHYVEAPVSGSRAPAEAGELVAMLAGDPVDVERVRPLMAPMCRETIPCGAVPGALLMKLAVNVFLITLVTGLAESVHFARTYGLDMERFVGVLAGGQMASPVMLVKAPKMVAEEFAPQASITNVWTNTRLISAAAAAAGISLPLLEASRGLFADASALGMGDADMAAVLKAVEAHARMG
ncbi:NAD(P)-dependent oxidoreductase [Pseudonocardia sp. TRM90224]|uniref:NAD(P)-dependent oxidoreductase n=1 Tax=Pseudonocardia sp. TRM90224 TaxID=2812678 RepID=UPI001E2F84F3|nr:NAD(P)-dependent oxidoreductase [Pseudonocardia sp. TRM90224]